MYLFKMLSTSGLHHLTDLGTPRAIALVVPRIEAEKMNLINQLEPAQATGKTKQFFDAVQAKLGAVPNLFRVLGTAPAALEGYLNFSSALAGGCFNAKIREQIALAVAESNLCGYCLSAHTFLGGRVGLTEKDIVDARHATAGTGKTDAILKLARGIVV
jgi:AhpD family alkylhydroperoxidase